MPRRMRIGHAAPGLPVLTAAVGSYNFTGQDVALSYASGVTGLPFATGYESGNLNAWDVVFGSMPATTDFAYEGDWSSQIIAPGGGTPNDNYLEYNFADHPSVDGTAVGTRDLWLRVAHRWSSDWNDNGYSSVQKVFLLNSHNPASGARRYQLTFNVWSPTSMYFCELLRWNEGGSSAGSTTANIDDVAPRVLGQWTEFVFRVRMNTPGNLDGILQIWTKAEGEVAYTQQIDRSNINYNDSTGFSPNRLIQSNYQPDGIPSGRRYWDSWQLQENAIDVSADAPDIGDSNFNFSNQQVTASPAILDLRQDYSSGPRNNVIWLSGVERLASYTYMPSGGFYGQGCGRFVPGRNTSDPVGNPKGDHPGGVGQLLFPTNPQIVTVGVLWRHGSTLLAESDGIKSLIFLRNGGGGTRPMIIPKGDWNTTGPGGGTVVLPACDGTKCNTVPTPGASDAEDLHWNDPATGVPDISGPWAQWVWTEASLDLTQTPSLFHVRSWLADGSEHSGDLIAKYLNEGSGGTIPGLDIIGYYNSIISPTANCFLEVERVEVHLNEFGPITPPVGFPGSAR